MTKPAAPASQPDVTLDVATLVAGFSAIFRAHPDATYLLDLDGRFLAVNDVLCERVQASREDLLGRTFDATVAAADSEFVRQKFREATRGEALMYEATGTRPDGTTFRAQIVNLPISVGETQVAVAGIAIDVTNRSDALDRSRASEDMLRLASRMARFGGWSVDAQTRQIRLTDDALRMFGVSPDLPLTNEVAWALHAPSDRTRVEGVLARCFDDGEPFDIESKMITTDGTELTTRTIGEPEWDGHGSVRRVHGAVWDITDFAQERDRARDLDERLTTSLRSISDGLVFLDDSLTVTFVNPMAEQLLGRAAAELVGKDLWGIYPLSRGTPFDAAFHEAVDTRESVVHQEWVELTELWLDVTIYPVETGIVMHLRDTTADVTARERERQASRRLEEQAALLDIARDAISVRDLDHRIQYWNRAAAELYEMPAADVLGRSVTELLYEHLEDFEAAAAEVMREGYWAGELLQRARSGRSIVVDCRWQLLYDDNGAPRAVLCINTDITAYRQAQESNARSQRMESLGTLAGGIAHDLNNVLTPVLMSAQLLALDEHDHDRREILATLEASAKRGAEMVRQVLAFARGVEGRHDDVSMDGLLDDVEGYARDVLPATISLSIHRPESLGSCTGDATQFMQVMTNLVLNARDAMASGGRLEIAAALEHFDTEVVSIGYVANAGDYVVFSVTDSGRGMSSDVVTMIFDPFFTTKGTSRGTGLGLSTTLGIVRSHGGFIEVTSNPDNGTTFRVGLPVNVAAVQQRAQRPAPPELPRGNGELVLVVDDEEFIRRITCQTLEAHGYRTVHASNGREAIDLIEAGDVHIDLVLTDMMMPVMDGAATTAYLEEHHPDIPIIAASGLASNGDSSGAVGMGVARFLSKPYTTSLLLTTVRETLGEHKLNKTVTT